ncbi:PREDICTED: non-specific lipid-transfer protein-like protein At2g13820 isoform X2 [Nicotiana attenuata]|uniref:non-specific lipid-transfer protein-like protein At2g13820 isoform X2 n=1 Tax=Nicotiana attenuata TaxID=49451 RepID=UPI000904CC6D|nr:PREDICTED: non-specific lipid-transfer protein-like protein At2g13820 isoform X2 [Nicotiana attenuata]
MATQRNTMSLVFIASAMIWTGAAAQSSDDCTNVLVSMSPCLNYITGNSSSPSSGCCTQLSTVVKNNPECLCQVLNGGGSNLGLNINQTQALALPTACKVQTPSVSKCNGRGSVPSTEGGSNDATLTKMIGLPFFILLFISSYASAFTTA